jgi:hypothetical protein
MRRTITWCTLAVLSLFAAGCGGEKSGDTTGSVPEAKATAAAPGTSTIPAAATTTAAATPPAATAAAAEPSAAPSATAAAETKTAAAAGTGSAAAGPKTFDCGAKGQKPCPMQAWMKSMMAAAASSGEGEKLSAALSYVASRTPPGFGTWTSMANAGAAKAKAGDIDGAKASCKQCHDAYRDKYKLTMRDRPF